MSQEDLCCLHDEPVGCNGLCRLCEQKASIHAIEEAVRERRERSAWMIRAPIATMTNDGVRIKPGMMVWTAIGEHGRVDNISVHVDDVEASPFAVRVSMTVEGRPFRWFTTFASAQSARDEAARLNLGFNPTPLARGIKP